MQSQHSSYRGYIYHGTPLTGVNSFPFSIQSVCKPANLAIGIECAMALDSSEFYRYTGLPIPKPLNYFLLHAAESPILC